MCQSRQLTYPETQRRGACTARNRPGTLARPHAANTTCFFRPRAPTTPTRSSNAPRLAQHSI